MSVGYAPFQTPGRHLSAQPQLTVKMLHLEIIGNLQGSKFCSRNWEECSESKGRERQHSKQKVSYTVDAVGEKRERDYFGR